MENYDIFIQEHTNQLIASGVPEHFWKVLHRKITTQSFDSGNTFSLTQFDYEGDDEKDEYDPIFQVQVKLEDGVDHMDPEQIYLIDHAWTFRVAYARKQLLNIEHLRERMAVIMGVDNTGDADIVVENIFNNMWKYVNTYTIGNADTVEERLPVWYVMDEVGSAMRHSDTANFRMVPFVYITEQMTYSLIFPTRKVEFAEVLTRDFMEFIEGDQREAFLIPWKKASLINRSYEHFEPNADYFLSGHIAESLPVLEQLTHKKPQLQKYKVYTQYEYIQTYLNDEHFECVDNEDDADILWYTRHFKDFEQLSLKPHKFVNQFPFEYILTIKDLLSITCRRKSLKSTNKLEILPKWLPTTYNLKAEIVEFVSYFQNREKEQMDNHWIIKPFNLARSLDTHITNNLNYILRLPATGAKIAQKYIENPVLFNREECGKVKFDIRYVLLLKCVKPLEVYVYKNFFLRFANKPFALNNFDQYEQHFTVMNYNQPNNLKKMLCSEFKHEWEQQYTSHDWNGIEKSIMDMIKEMFECAIMEPPPCGISASPQSRALYAMDLMLEWSNGDIQPKVLEVNWTPDCKRACEYYPEFYNDIFKLLFLDVENDDVFYKL